MKKIVEWMLTLLVALVLIQTLYFKFGAHQDSVWIFSKLGAEPSGRIALGIVELILTVLVLIPTTRRWAAVGVMLTMIGAMLSHIFVLGIEVQQDGGLLFALACITFSCAMGIFVLRTIRKKR